MDLIELEQTSQTREGISSVIEILERDFGYDAAPAYKKRNLIRALYFIAIAAVDDSKRELEMFRTVIKKLRTEHSTTFQGAEEMGGKNES